jgi:hypothetical protein
MGDKTSLDLYFSWKGVRWGKCLETDHLVDLEEDASTSVTIK